ncbi:MULTISPECIES: hypothetical protein [unclassified Gordonia (in: high G+C Gram-positive bacteria)]|uniref:hypothetical protein n=1 Tax=Gordonia TaxID=2053 RepID=UPI001F06FA11|nr:MULTISPECIES: hypothetical protein [unclassified Gordonia (in: high G+C Gram-positive bacteria)]MDT0221928.1 hypothetical protein [Gordonia sp. AC31]
MTRDDFAALPITTKIDYLAPHELDELMWDGDISRAQTWSATSGSTGSPTYFPRDSRAARDAADYYGRIFEECFDIGGHTTLVVVCFAMGTWIGGTYSYQAALGLHEDDRRITVATPGIDVAAAVASLVELGPRHEKVILAGYPPLVKDVLDMLPADALTQDLHLLLAGEGITERWRDHVLERFGRLHRPERVCLMYGTAEAGVMGHETPTTVTVRRAAFTSDKLRRELFGRNATPLTTFVEVDPMRRYTEVDEDGYLLFTIDSALPLVRYRINDQGRVLTGLELQEVLKMSGFDDLSTIVDPEGCFVVLTGRPDVATSFYSSSIFPAQLASAFDAASVARSVTGRFCADGSPGDDHCPVLRIDVELSAGATTPEPGLAERLRSLCLAALLDNNDEFRTLRSSHGEERTTPVVNVHPYGTGPFRPGAKHTYTLRGRR